jgi:hypothetical protein
MHIICAFARAISEIRIKILEYVNICFHIILLAPLFALGYSIEIAVLFFMSSVFIRTALGAISFKWQKRNSALLEAFLAGKDLTDSQTDGEVKS